MINKLLFILLLLPIGCFATDRSMEKLSNLMITELDQEVEWDSLQHKNNFFLFSSQLAKQTKKIYSILRFSNPQTVFDAKNKLKKELDRKITLRQWNQAFAKELSTQVFQKATQYKQKASKITQQFGIKVENNISYQQIVDNLNKTYQSLDSNMNSIDKLEQMNRALGKQILTHKEELSKEKESDVSQVVLMKEIMPYILSHIPEYYHLMLQIDLYQSILECETN